MTAFVGEIRLFAFNFAPSGWALCNGQLLPISEQETLFNLIGTTYGGDGQETFAVPNLQGRAPVHVGPGAVLGQLGGVSEVALTTTQVPPHTHTVLGGLGKRDTTSAGNAVLVPGDMYATIDPAAPPATTLSTNAVLSTGSSQPHDNMQPYLTANYCISLFGVFPSQS